MEVLLEVKEEDLPLKIEMYCTSARYLSSQPE